MIYNYLNASFEFISAILTWASVFRLTDERSVKGIVGGYFVFSAVWAIAALGYYWQHDDYFSTAACAFRATGLVVWSLFYLYFRRAEKPAKLYSIRGIDKSLSNKHTS